MSARLAYQVICRCEAPSAAVWDALLDVDRYPEWMPGVTDSTWEQRGHPDTHEGSIRRIRVQRLTVREQVTGGRRPHHHAYVALSGVPVRNYCAEIRIDDRPGGCLITWEASFGSPIPMVRSLIRRSMRISITKTAAALAQEAQRRNATTEIEGTPPCR